MSTASSISSEFLSFPVCGDCLLDFDGGQRKPLLLPCQHAFCRSCLNDQEDKDGQKCPTCSLDWGCSNVTQLPVVYDLIPPREDTTSASRGRSSTAPSGRSKSSARFPVCIVCNEDFNTNSQRPLKLPCGHCFCQSCLEVLRNAAKSSCPQCRGEWATTDMSRLPIVKSLIHPFNRDKNVPRAPSAAAGNGGSGGMSDDDKLRVADELRLRNSGQTRQIKSQIFVTDTQNRTHTLCVDLQTTTVTQLRTLVADATGVEPQHQRLVLGSQQLEDGRTLAQCRIRADARITLTCRLRGGF